MTKPRARTRGTIISPADGVAASPLAQLATPSKREQVATLLLRNEGATLDQMIGVTGWLPHTARAALSGLRKAGYLIESDKVDGVRTYRAVTPK